MMVRFTDMGDLIFLENEFQRDEYKVKIEQEGSGQLLGVSTF